MLESWSCGLLGTVSENRRLGNDDCGEGEGPWSMAARSEGGRDQYGNQLGGSGKVGRSGESINVLRVKFSSKVITG